MLESLHELRKKVQEPVRAYNDIAGVLVGDRVSIHVTRVFLALGLSPNVGTIGMLVSGLAGSVLTLFGGGLSVLGFALLFAYYVFDCVDGEVARYRKAEKLAWGFHDFLFHLYVKAAFFTCLGVYAVRTTDRGWAFGLALAALFATLFTKALYDAALVLTARYVLLRTSDERVRFTRELLGDSDSADLDAGDRVREVDPQAERRPMTLGRVPGVTRAVLTNFDLSILFFLAAAVIDLFRVPMVVSGVEFDMKCALLGFYGVVLPLDFLDRLYTYLRQDGFRRDARRLVQSAHRFRVG